MSAWEAAVAPLLAPRVVAFDPSIAATGVALADGTVETIKYPKGVKDDRRLNVILERTLEVAVGADYAVLELLPQHMKAAGITGMAQGAVRIGLNIAEVPYASLSPGTVKKFATGKGNADKPDMRMALYQRAGLDLKDDNQVDAWWLRALALHWLGHPVVQLPKSHLAWVDQADLGWPR